MENPKKTEKDQQEEINNSEETETKTEELTSEQIAK